MDTICKDAVFGEMIYKHRWYKKQPIEIFGKEWEITIAAKAYSGKPITDEQRNAYHVFMQEQKKQIEIVEEQLKSYVNTNLQVLAENWVGARRINNVKELAQMVTPRTLLFKQDGTTLLLLDCVWDVESGVAVKLTENVIVGSQDLFL